jgi:hypothetical protein
MNCSEFHDLLQRRLDGIDRFDQAVADRHVAECPTCRSWLNAAEHLENGLRHSRLPSPPSKLADRIVRRVVGTYRRRVVYHRFAAAAVAAGLLVAAFVGYQWRWASGPSEPAVAKGEPRAEAALSLRDNVDGAVDALTGLVNQTAEKALEPGRSLLPDKISVTLLTETAARQSPAKVAVPSLREASQGVTSFAPVAGLGRFFNYFAQDLPAMEPERNSGS